MAQWLNDSMPCASAMWLGFTQSTRRRGAKFAKRGKQAKRAKTMMEQIVCGRDAKSCVSTAGGYNNTVHVETQNLASLPSLPSLQFYCAVWLWSLYLDVVGAGPGGDVLLAEGGGHQIGELIGCAGKYGYAYRREKAGIVMIVIRCALIVKRQ